MIQVMTREDSHPGSVTVRRAAAVAATVSAAVAATVAAAVVAASPSHSFIQRYYVHFSV